MTDILTIVLPGRAYGALGPALRIPVLAMKGVGAEVADVEYPALPEPMPAETGWWQELYRSVTEQASSAVRRAGAGKVAFVAKSLGTMALAGLEEQAIGAEVAGAIWITPLFGFEAVRSGAMHRAWPSLLVAGEADEAHDRAGHEAVRKALRATSLVLPGADHSLEVAGDVLATVEGLAVLARAARDFALTL